MTQKEKSEGKGYSLNDTGMEKGLFAKDCTAENLEMKRKYRNITTREHKKAIRAYEYIRADEHKSTPSKFYDTFKPFY